MFVKLNLSPFLGKNHKKMDQRVPDRGGGNEKDPEIRIDFVNCVYDSLSPMVN
jgi:hypothetical protein